MNPLHFLLRAILSEPDEDVPRLAFADELQQQGDDARAEFIRVQCELAILERPNSSADPKRHLVVTPKGEFAYSTPPDLYRLRELRVRQLELWKDSGEQGWWQMVPGSYRSTFGRDTQISTAEGMVFVIRRGFVESMISTAELFLTHADALSWHAGATMECPECNETGAISVGFQPALTCPVCQGAGRVPRPCPPSAQPIVRVVFSVAPDGEVSRLGALRDWKEPPKLGDHILDCFHAEWPGVEFVLPSAVDDALSVGAAHINDVLASLAGNPLQ